MEPRFERGAGRYDEVERAWALGPGEWTFPLVYALDVARWRLAGGDPAAALAALWLGLRGAQRVTPPMRRLLAGCVRARRSLARLGLRVALSGGTASERALSVLAVLRAVAAPRVSRQTRSTDAAGRSGGTACSASPIRETNWLLDR